MLNPTKQQNIMEDGRVYADLQVLIKLQHKASGFGFLPRQPIHSLLAGRHASRMRGRGLDFEEIRHHLPGDDIRNMNLKVTARIGKPFSNNADAPVMARSLRLYRPNRLSRRLCFAGR